MTTFTEAKKRYNTLMNDLGLEYLTIGTSFSEDTQDWNLRDMVSEAQYQLDVCYEDGNASADGRYIYEYMDTYCVSLEEAQEIHKAWLSKTMRLRNFINKYKAEALTIECTTGHCSKYD